MRSVCVGQSNRSGRIFLAFMIRCPMLFGGRPFWLSLPFFFGSAWLSLPSLAFFSLCKVGKKENERGERIEKEIPPIPKLENGTLSCLFLRDTDVGKRLQTTECRLFCGRASSWDGNFVRTVVN